MDSLTLGTLGLATVLVAGAYLYSRSKGSSPIPVLAARPTATATPAGRAFLDLIDETGKNIAGDILVSRLGAARGQEYVSLFEKGLAPEAPTKSDPKS